MQAVGQSVLRAYLCKSPTVQQIGSVQRLPDQLLDLESDEKSKGRPKHNTQRKSKHKGQEDRRPAVDRTGQAGGQITKQTSSGQDPLYPHELVLSGKHSHNHCEAHMFSKRLLLPQRAGWVCLVNKRDTPTAVRLHHSPTQSWTI